MLVANKKYLFKSDKLHLIAYGDDKYKKAKERIFMEANNSKWFYTTNIYCKEDLSINFCKEFKNVLNMYRGGGYWIWKFDLIIRKLVEINDGDLLIYVDSGCTININGEERLNEYIELIKNDKHKIISFQMCHIEKKWTTKQIFDLFDISPNDIIQNSGQYMATILIMQKCNNVIKIFNDSLEIIRKDHKIITDYYNNQQNNIFIENRHDQSILSIIRKKYGSIVIPDETYFHDFNVDSVKKIPFLATKKRNE